jgi:hypothetical protein
MAAQKKTMMYMTFMIGNACLGLGQAYKGGGIKPVRWDPNLPCIHTCSFQITPCVLIIRFVTK